MSLSSPGSDRTIMVIPTYNEAANIEWIVGTPPRGTAGRPRHGRRRRSPDGTGKIADRLAATDDHVQVVHRTEKAGLGAAYLHGFRVALEQGFDVVGEMDADGSHQPEQLHRLREALARAPTW